MKGPMLWGAIVVSLFVMVGFTGLSFLMFSRVITGDMKEIALFVLGAWSALATGVVSFWVGSSVGSMQKTALMEKQT